MLLLISPEKDLPNEIDTLHSLFKSGLTHFHFKKPTASLKEHIAHLNKVDSRYHQFIMTRNFHKELCDQFGFKRHAL